MKNIKTLSQFKREIKNKEISLQLLEVYGQKPNDKMKGVREISKVQSNGFYLKSEYNGEIFNSWLAFPKSKDFKYIDDCLEIYEYNQLILKYKIYYK